MFREVFFGLLHPFILYTVVGTAVAFLLVKAFSRWHLFQEPRQRVVLLSVALLVPVAGYFIIKVLLNRGCVLLLDSSPNWLCHIADFLVFVLTPLSLAVGLVATIKAVASIYGCLALYQRYGFASRDEYPLLFGLLTEISGKAGIKAPHIIVTSQKYARCFTFGVKSPTIVLSQGILDNLDREELEAVLAHEIAHIARYDTASSWIMVFLRDLMFFTPITYWLFSSYQGAKEMAADDISIRLTEKPLPYAQALIKVWRLSPQGVLPRLAFDNFSPYPGFLSNKGSLENRVERMIEPAKEGIYRSLKPSWAIASMISMVSIAILAVVC